MSKKERPDFLEIIQSAIEDWHPIWVIFLVAVTIFFWRLPKLVKVILTYRNESRKTKAKIEQGKVKLRNQISDAKQTSKTKGKH